MSNTNIYISYYTPNYKNIYEEYLKPSLKKLDLKYYTEIVEDRGSWKLNTDFKPLFIKQCLGKFNENLIFCDVDAKINSYPELFENIPEEFDIGVYYYSGELENQKVIDQSGWGILSGTIYIKNTKKIINLIDKWISFLPTVRWEQAALDLAIRDTVDLLIYKLPRSYCYVVSKPNGKIPNNPLNDPIISHFQSSRIMRNR